MQDKNMKKSYIFCGYIGYDWAESQTKTHTLDNSPNFIKHKIN